MGHRSGRRGADRRPQPTVVAQSRTTTTGYDAADRVTSVLVTADGARATVASMAKTVNAYDAASGHVTVVSAAATGAVTSTVEKVFDRLGRMMRYVDGSGGWTNSGSTSSASRLR